MTVAVRGRLRPAAVSAGSWLALVTVTLAVGWLTEVGPVVEVSQTWHVRLLECVVLCKGGFVASTVTALCWQQRPAHR
jgi:hypothetical protein